MLKLVYTETGLQLECLPEALEQWLTVRLLLSLRAGQQLVMEPCTASLLLLRSLVEQSELEAMAQHDLQGAIALTPCDADYLEVTLNGTWVCSRPGQSEGVFVALLGAAAETLLLNLWSGSSQKPKARPRQSGAH